jgi:phage major head subunit gpT-like protein
MNLIVILAVVGAFALICKQQVVKSTGLSVAGLRSEFFNRYNQIEKLYGALCTTYASEKGTENHKWLGPVPPMREWDSGRLWRGLRTESYDVTNQKYESTIAVDRDESDDDQTGQIRQRVNAMAVAAATHPTTLLEALFNNGATAGYLAYDGQIFFSAAHVSGDSGMQNNTISVAAATGTAPTAAEFRDALGQALARQIGFKDDQGEPVRLPMNAQSLICVVPPSMYLVALEAVGLPFNPTTPDPVARNVLQAAAQVLCLPGLTATDTWFLCNVGGWIRPFIFQVRSPIEFTALEENSETGFRRDMFLYGVRARYAMAYALWQAAIQVTFT